MQTPSTQDASRDASRPDRRWANRLSTILFIAAIIFAAAAVWLYFMEESEPEGPTAPTAEAGRIELSAVMTSLTDADLDASYGRFTATASQLEQPGQAIEVEEHNLFVFIYPDADPAAAVAAREADGADLDPETLVLESRSAERPLNENEESHVFQKSNVIVILVGGDEQLVTAVQDAIESLP
jgi:hypothetical protein